MNNPKVILKLGDQEVMKIDLWWLVLVYASREARASWSSLKLFLDGEEVLRDFGETPTPAPVPVVVTKSRRKKGK
jgi:hypothetical protein